MKLLYTTFLLLLSLNTMADSMNIMPATGKLRIVQDLNAPTSSVQSAGKLNKIYCPTNDSTYGPLSKVFAKSTTTVLSQPTGAVLSATMEYNDLVSTMPIAIPIRLGNNSVVNLTINRSDMVTGVAQTQTLVWCQRSLDAVIVPMEIIVPGATLTPTKGHVIANFFQYAPL